MTTKDLLDELESRFDHFIFAGMRDIDKESDFEFRRHKGGWRVCQGLATGIIFSVEQQRSEEIEPLSEDDTL